MNIKLFAVYLGGRAHRCNTELHDVVFVQGRVIEDTYEQLMDLWFGFPEGLHIDSWMELNIVDGYEISLVEEDPMQESKLYFVNLGAYHPGQFTELHANTFIIAKDRKEIINRARKELLIGMNFVHTDDIYDVDDCIEIVRSNQLYVKHKPTSVVSKLIPNNGYRIIPKNIVADYLKQHPQRARENQTVL